MPPVDIETLFFVSSGDTITEDPDLPPESIQLPICDDLRWFKLNKVLDRGLSTIGNANPKSTRTTTTTTKPKSHLQKNPKKPPNGPIPGLANSAFHANVTRPLPALRIFPLNFSVGPNPSVPDPESPKVSCFGRVSEEGRIQRGAAGCWGNLPVFLGFAGVSPAADSGEEEGSRSAEFSGEEERRPPEMQGMRRFASGRPAGDVDGGSGRHVVLLEPLDREQVMRS